MTYVIVEACIGVKDRACVDVCPVDCIYEGEDQLYIHPDECIDCGACEPECPVTAIFPEEDVPPNQTAFIEKNKEVFNSDTPPGGQAIAPPTRLPRPSRKHREGLLYPADREERRAAPCSYCLGREHGTVGW